MLRIASLLCASLLVAGVAACGHDSNPAGNSWDDPAVASVSADDPEMNAVIAESRRTLDEFIRLLEHPTPTQSDPGLKVEFVEAGKHEHIWIGEVKRVEGGFEGVVGNTPVDIHRLKLGEKVRVRPEDVSDWMVVDDGKLIGGRSIRLFRDRMKPDERAQFDREMPFRMEN